MPDRPLCFVLMPFGVKRDHATGDEIDFDAIYRDSIRPAIQDAGMEPLRADEERTGGIIHRAMFERLLLADFAVADLTTANANVFYELGVRHAARPSTTLAIFASRQMPPFDVNYLRALPYELEAGEDAGGPGEAGEAGSVGSAGAGAAAARVLRRERVDGGSGADGARPGDPGTPPPPSPSSTASVPLRTSLAARLRELRALASAEGTVDSPVFQLIDGYAPPEIARLATDSFRDRARYSARVRDELEWARSSGDAGEVAAVEDALGSLDGAEAGVLIDLLLSYRALEAWDRMIALYDRLPATLRRSTMVREQHAFALNRAGERARAVRVLEELIAERGPSSENCGLLGRVHKDLWQEARKAGSTARAAGCLRRAIAAYRRGFEVDPRDAYPGINAVTLLEMEGGSESLRARAELLPVVRFAVQRRLRNATPDYWDHATLLELAVLEGDREAALRHLGDALAAVREVWEPRSTAGNLDMIREARAERGLHEPWLAEVVEELRSVQDGVGSGGSTGSAGFT
jgi:tetratricopeptide (TPR) repeat protein